jgi:hypothetical protein
MRRPEILETLREIRFLDGISDFREGERLDAVFLVADGTVALEVRVPEQAGLRTLTAPRNAVPRPARLLHSRTDCRSPSS